MSRAFSTRYFCLVKFLNRILCISFHQKRNHIRLRKQENRIKRLINKSKNEKKNSYISEQGSDKRKQGGIFTLFRFTSEFLSLNFQLF